MQSSDNIEERVDALEARVKALLYVGLPFVAISIFNFGVAIWYFQQKSKPDWNFISVTLTIFEMLLAIALVGGFWMLRGAAETAAAKEAKSVATEVAEKAARTSALQWLELAKTAQSDTNSDNTDLTDMINSFGEAKTGGKDGT